MADQSVRIANLPDSGSPQRVALELANTIKYAEHGTSAPPSPRKYMLDLYAECLSAAWGNRPI